MEKRILLALTSHDRKGDTGQRTGAYAPEIAHPYNVFRAAGYAVDFASVRGGDVPLDGVDRPDEPTSAFLADASLRQRLRTSVSSAVVKPADYVAIFFAGGHGTMWDFPDDPGFQRTAAQIYAASGVIAAVCHGPAALVNLRLPDGRFVVDGQDVTGFTNEEEKAAGMESVVPFLLEDRLVARGGRFTSAAKWQAHVVTSGRLVTWQNPASAAGTAEATIAALRGATRNDL